MTITTAAASAATNASAPARITASAPAPITATSTINNRPDSGVQGNNWALDTFTRTATIQRVGEVALSFCPGSDTGHCYLWHATIADSGTFTTIAGQAAPRTGTLDLALTGKMAGGTTAEQFYASWKTASELRVPLTEVDQGEAPTGPHTTTNWVEQFFGSPPSSTRQPTPAAPTSAPRPDGPTR